MKRLVDEVTTAFAKHHLEILMGQLKGSLLQYCSADIEIGINRAKDLAREKIFEHPNKAGCWKLLRIKVYKIFWMRLFRSHAT